VFIEGFTFSNRLHV